MVERLEQSDEQLLAEAAVKAQRLAEQLRADAAELRTADPNVTGTPAAVAAVVMSTAEAADELARALEDSLADAPPARVNPIS